MSHTEPRFELTLTVTTTDEGAAARVFEQLSRMALGVRLAEDVSVSLEPDRYDVHCHHPEHDDEDEEVG